MNTLNVQDFGAVGDGTTHDSSAIDAALAVLAANPVEGGVLFFPTGNYLYDKNEPLDLTVAAVWMRGSGRGATRFISAATTAPGIKVCSSPENAYNKLTDIDVAQAALTETPTHREWSAIRCGGAGAEYARVV